MLFVTYKNKTTGATFVLSMDRKNSQTKLEQAWATVDTACRVANWNSRDVKPVKIEEIK